jgi:hypothetical protein
LKIKKEKMCLPNNNQEGTLVTKVTAHKIEFEENIDKDLRKTLYNYRKL